MSNYGLFIILNDLSKLDDVHNILYEHKCGATTVDSEGLGKVLTEHHVDVPVFAGIRSLIKGHKSYNKTIMSVIHNEEKLREVVDDLKKELHIGSGQKGGTAFMFVIPVLECHGYIIED